MFSVEVLIELVVLNMVIWCRFVVVFMVRI